MALSNIQVIHHMYHGEERRDARSNLRGFFYQDLIAVDELIKPGTHYVCSEYLEDVFVETEEAVFIIQAKYYPKSNVSTSKIVRDLYYQFLRMELYGYTGKVIPILVVHTNIVPIKPDLSTMKGPQYVNVNRSSKPSPPKDVDAWLTKHVYSLNKDQAEDICFQNFACDDSITIFLREMRIISNLGTIKLYREAIADKLDTIGFSDCSITNSDIRKKILLGLAIQFIEDSYNEIEDSSELFNFCKRDRQSFIEYLRNHISIESNERIGAYLRIVVLECWDMIEAYNDQITQDQLDLLQIIRDNLADWIYNLGNSTVGELQLINTVSMRDKSVFANFQTISVAERMRIIYEHHDRIVGFILFFWKIIFNINKSLIGKMISISDSEKLKAELYIDPTEIRYLKMKFPGESSDSPIIISSPNNVYGSEELACVFARMKDFQPTKWYMKGRYKGIHSYSQSVSDIINNSKVSTIAPERFRIECMDCINVDANCWQTMEDCQNTIFLDRCISDFEVIL